MDEEKDGGRRAGAEGGSGGGEGEGDDGDDGLDSKRVIVYRAPGRRRRGGEEMLIPSCVLRAVRVVCEPSTFGVLMVSKR